MAQLQALFDLRAKQLRTTKSCVVRFSVSNHTFYRCLEDSHFDILRALLYPRITHALDLRSSQQEEKNMSQYVIFALYKFVTLEDYQSLQAPLLEVMEANQIGGTLLLAHEGINGTVAAPRENMDALFAWFKKRSTLSRY